MNSNLVKGLRESLARALGNKMAGGRIARMIYMDSMEGGNIFPQKESVIVGGFQIARVEPDCTHTFDFVYQVGGRLYGINQLKEMLKH